MGMFSWVCSDSGKALTCYDCSGKNTTKKAFMLIPKEFGGGSYKVDNNYDGYGVFYDDNGKGHDAFEELAKWNGVAVKDDKQESRCKAIDLYYTPLDSSRSQYEDGNYNNEEVMDYPLKIVEKEVAYELAEPCTDDSNQGWGDSIEDDEDYEEFEDEEL